MRLPLLSREVGNMEADRCVGALGAQVVGVNGEPQRRRFQVVLRVFDEAAQRLTTQTA